ncbi:DUF402 domain-containing protein [Macrococcus sp. EM39E]|uniref:DUF402 domain-containing protein n=1 Tax=Macrococcus animalis TaxID=3395467 RepID=UPI0039BDAB29
MNNIKVEIYKYDDKIHYSWESELIEETEEYIVLKSEPPRTLNHFTRNKTFVYDNASIEYISKTEGFTINIDIYDDGRIEYYCNICAIPKKEDNIIKIIDLDIDMIIDGDGKHYFVDEDEFEANKSKYDYPLEVINNIETLKYKLDNLYTERIFPFDGFLIKHVEKVTRDLK